MMVTLLLATGDAFGEADKPIIAHMLADQDAFDGRDLTIYGLVIDVTDGGRAFMLQDVSQMPLKVIPPAGVLILAGDQVLVKGIFEVGKHEPQFNATKIQKTKVLGGGGCC